MSEKIPSSFVTSNLSSSESVEETRFDLQQNREQYPLEKIDLIVPSVGKLFFETKTDFQLCKPHLMPLKSITLEKLEKMQKDAYEQLRQNQMKLSTATETVTSQESH